jgi:PUA-domain protein
MQKQLSNSEIKHLNAELTKFNAEIGKKDRVVRKNDILLVNNIPMFFYLYEKILPTLKANPEYLKAMKKVVVDMGALKPISSGADLMRPGVKDADLDIKKEDFVAIVDEKYLRPIAVGISIFSGKELMEIKSGRVVKIVHRVGDHIWNCE